MKRSIILYISVAFFIVFQTIAFGAANVVKPEVNKKLEGTEWINVNSSENVRYGVKKWKNEKDLSFRYRINFDDGKLYVHVEVKDDKVILKKGDTIISDHVEIWLADNRIASDYESFLADLKSMKENYVGDEEDKDRKAFNKKLINEIDWAIGYLKKDQWFTQIIFNLDKIIDAPVLVNPAKYQYEKNDSGYSFWLVISLYGSMSLKNETIKQLSYLVDIADIDNNSAIKQEKLISSSYKREYANPQTFNFLDFPANYSFKLDEEIEIGRKLESEGVIKLDRGALNWEIKREELFVHDWNSAFIPAGWGPIDFQRIINSDSIDLLAWKKQLVVKKNKKSTVIDVSDLIDAAGGFEYKLIDKVEKKGMIYFLIDVRGGTRWPGGSGMCGSGSEANMIWLKLSHDLNQIDSKSVHYESCPFSTYSTVGPEQDPYIKLENTIELEYENSRDNIIQRAIYNRNKPELGIVIKEIKKTE